MLSSKTRQYAVRVLTQQANLLKRICPTVYQRPCPVLGSSVGQHIRHSVDHFQRCIFTPRTDVVLYDKRERGTEVETVPDSARAVIEDCLKGVEGLPDQDVAMNVQFTMCGDTGECEVFRSSVSRELAFASHHAIHHNAMIRAIASIPGNGWLTHLPPLCCSWCLPRRSAPRCCLLLLLLCGYIVGHLRC